MGYITGIHDSNLDTAWGDLTDKQREKLKGEHGDAAKSTYISAKKQYEKDRMAGDAIVEEKEKFVPSINVNKTLYSEYDSLNEEQQAKAGSKEQHDAKREEVGLTGYDTTKKNFRKAEKGSKYVTATDVGDRTIVHNSKDAGQKLFDSDDVDALKDKGYTQEEVNTHAANVDRGRIHASAQLATGAHMPDDVSNLDAYDVYSIGNQKAARGKETKGVDLNKEELQYLMDEGGHSGDDLDAWIKKNNYSVGDKAQSFLNDYITSVQAPDIDPTPETETPQQPSQPYVPNNPYLRDNPPMSLTPGDPDDPSSTDNPYKPSNPLPTDQGPSPSPWTPPSYDPEKGGSNPGKTTNPYNPNDKYTPISNPETNQDIIDNFNGWAENAFGGIGWSNNQPTPASEAALNASTKFDTPESTEDFIYRHTALNSKIQEDLKHSFTPHANVAINKIDDIVGNQIAALDTRIGQRAQVSRDRSTIMASRLFGDQWAMPIPDWESGLSNQPDPYDPDLGGIRDEVRDDIDDIL